jgi:hypothetical protein
MKIVAAVYVLIMAGCHNGFCHNELFLLGSFLGAVPFVGLRFKMWLNNTHKKVHKDVAACEEKCAEHKRI